VEAKKKAATSIWIEVIFHLICDISQILEQLNKKKAYKQQECELIPFIESSAKKEKTK
jgi:hypothetical protein